MRWGNIVAAVSLPIVQITIAAIATLALLWGIWWLWWRLPQRQVARLTLKIRDPKDRADVEDSFRKTIGQALGGAAVLGAAIATPHGRWLGELVMLRQDEQMRAIHSARTFLND